MNYSVQNFFENIEIPHGDEKFFPMFENSTLRIERIVSNGAMSAQGYWYDQEKDEWVMVMQGEAIIEIENQDSKHLKKGDYLFIPAHQKHRVVYTSENPVCLWLAVHFLF